MPGGNIPKNLKTGGVYPQGPKINWQNEFVNRTLA